MQIPHLNKIKEVEIDASLKPGVLVGVQIANERIPVDGYKVVSVAKSFGGKTLVLTKDSTTLIIKSTDIKDSSVIEATLISGTVKVVDIAEIYIRARNNHVRQVSLSDFTYKGVEKQDVLTPLAPGDTLETANKKFIVEYIASDGSIVAKVEGKSQAKLTTECVMINPKDASILKALFTRPVWK